MALSGIGGQAELGANPGAIVRLPVNMGLARCTECWATSVSLDYSGFIVCLVTLR